jgi:hypothetical protein
VPIPRLRRDVNIDRLARAYQTAAHLFPQEIDELQRRVAYGMRDEAQTYEAAPAPTGRKMVWKSDRQRKYVMWALAQGIITYPSRRTGHMSRQTVAKRLRKLAWLVEMRAEYSHWVRGQQQARQHTGRWTKWKTIERRHVQGYLAQARELAKLVLRRAGRKA